MDKRILAAAIGIVSAATLAVVAPATYAGEVVYVPAPTNTAPAITGVPSVNSELRSKVGGSSY